MERENRPHGREKHITGEGSVHKRGEGLHMSGPLGESHGYEDKKEFEQNLTDDRDLADSLIHMASGGGASSSENSLEHIVENLVVQEVAKDIKTKGGRRKLLLIGALVVVALICFGGLNLFGTLGQSAGISPGHPLIGGGSGNSNASGNRSALDTTVADGARDKRTLIAGGGQDIITIMVYMCGTDLESKYGMATSDLTEMANANISDKINLIVYTGGCEQWKNNIVSSRANQIYQVKDAGLVPIVQDAGERAMTDPETLTGFIKFCRTEYPADRYDLIMWDHGGGSISGYGYDQKFPRSGSMTLDKINSALKNAECTFDFIGFDACLMATLETSLMLEPYADYLIGSEETEPGVGWYYTNWLTALSENTSMSTLETGKRICDDFVEVCAQKTPSDQTTLSIIDLAELGGTVPESFAKFAESTGKLVRSDDFEKVSNARSRAKEFAASAGIDQVDLVDLASGIESNESKNLVKVLKSCVKYNRTSSNVKNAYGISIYFPYGKLSSVDKMVSTYDKIGMDAKYTNCIKSFASLETGGQAIAGGTGNPLGSLLGNLGGSGNSSAEPLSSNMVSQLLGNLLSGGGFGGIDGLTSGNTSYYDNRSLNVQYLTETQFDKANLAWKAKGDKKVLKLPEDQWDLVQSVELNVFLDDGEGYIDLGLDNVFAFDDDGDLIGDYDGSWLAINGQPVSYYMISQETDGDNDTITGRVPAMLNGELVDIILVFDQDHPDGYVAGARIRYDGDETDTQARGMIEIVDGDKIDLLCDYYTYDEEYIDSYYLGEQITVEGQLLIDNVSIVGSAYKATYRLTDIYNNHYWTSVIE